MTFRGAVGERPDLPPVGRKNRLQILEGNRSNPVELVAWMFFRHRSGKVSDFLGVVAGWYEAITIADHSLRASVVGFDCDLRRPVQFRQLVENPLVWLDRRFHDDVFNLTSRALIRDRKRLLPTRSTISKVSSRHSPRHRSK